MAITLSHGGDSIFTSSSPSNEILVGTKEGVVWIKRQGSEWGVTHRALTDKHIHAVIIEPVSGTIFVGATFGSIYASEDGGQTWEQRDNGLTEHDIYSLASVGLNGGTRIFAGTEPAHLFSSDDMGKHWSELSAMLSVDTSRWTFPVPPNIAHTKHINFHPNDPNTLFISIEQGGLLKSTDGGRTFRVIPGMDDDVHRTVINPMDPDRIWITGGDGMYVTSDGGDNWEHWTTIDDDIGGYPDVMVVHPRSPDLVFIGAAREQPGAWRGNRYTAGSQVSTSTDGGRNWKAWRNGLTDRIETSFEAMSLDDWGESFSIFAATGTGEIWASEDGGENWSEIISGLAPISKGEHYALLMPA